MRNAYSLVILGGLFTLAFNACSDFPCSPGEVQKNGECIPDPTLATGGTTGGSSSSGSSSSSGAQGGAIINGGSGPGTGGAASGGSATGGAATGGSSSGGQGGLGGMGGTAPIVLGTFGDTCLASEECASEAPYCAFPPGPQTSGTCTAQGCKTNPALCPNTYKCLSFADVCIPRTKGDFGAVCTTDADCADPAPLCGKAPGAATGTCTVSGCNANASLCPTYYKCLSFVNVCVVKNAGDFGALCDADSDCGDPAPTCGEAPGAAYGSCTVTGCNGTPSLCPNNYSCFAPGDICIAN